MGLLNKLFKKSRNDEPLFGDAKATISKDGFPICPLCQHRYHLTTKQIKKMAENHSMISYICDGCNKTIEL